MHKTGFTLLEFLLTTSMGLVVLLSIFSLYLNLQRQHQQIMSYLKLQQQANVCLQLLRNELKADGGLKENKYVVQFTHRYDALHQPVYALYIRNEQGQKDEYVQGVEQLHFTQYENSAHKAAKVELQIREGKLVKKHYGFITI